MDYESITSEVKKLYGKEYARKYKESDELEIKSENHKHICNILKDISCSFGHKISVLDLGCGTGRYFHCLENVERLTGIDISPNMLEEACNPVEKSKIKFPVDLVCGNIFLDEAIDAKPFNFIYSIGVLGEHSPFDLTICNRLFDFLKPDGKLLVTCVDDSFKKKSFKRRLAEAVLKLSAPKYFKKLRERFKSFSLTDKELRAIMQASKFDVYEISRHISSSIYWEGAHLECLAVRTK